MKLNMIKSACQSAQKDHKERSDIRARGILRVLNISNTARIAVTRVMVGGHGITPIKFIEIASG